MKDFNDIDDGLNRYPKLKQLFLNDVIFHNIVMRACKDYEYSFEEMLVFCVLCYVGVTHSYENELLKTNKFLKMYRSFNNEQFNGHSQKM